MAHLFAFRCRKASDVGDDRLGHMLGCPLCGILLGATANFTNHHDGLGGIIVFKCFKGFLQRGANDGIAASAQACGEADIG